MTVAETLLTVTDAIERDPARLRALQDFIDSGEVESLAAEFQIAADVLIELKILKPRA